MANDLKMDQQVTLRILFYPGWVMSRIAREVRLPHIDFSGMPNIIGNLLHKRQIVRNNAPCQPLSNLN